MDENVASTVTTTIIAASPTRGVALSAVAPERDPAPVTNSELGDDRPDAEEDDTGR
jgi:hypothetical protein